jgi:hypothetical protein
MKHASTTGAALRALAAWAFAIACLSGSFAHAQAAGALGGEGAPSAGARHSHRRAVQIGDATSAWLELQRSNAAAAPALPMPGAQATLAYERYMNSFRTKIPATFGSAFVGESGALRADSTSAGAAAAPPAGSN